MSPTVVPQNQLSRMHPLEEFLQDERSAIAPTPATWIAKNSEIASAGRILAARFETAKIPPHPRPASRTHLAAIVGHFRLIFATNASVLTKCSLHRYSIARCVSSCAPK